MEHGDEHEEQQHVPDPKCGHTISSHTGNKQHYNHDPDPEPNQKAIQED